MRLRSNLDAAQKYLDNRVLQDSNVFVPFRGDKLRESGTNGTVIGSGEVKWISPYAHYQYEGKTMVGVQSRSAWARQGEPKVYDGGNITYHAEGTGSHWFQKASEHHKKDWVRGTKKVAGGK